MMGEFAGAHRSRRCDARRRAEKVSEAERSPTHFLPPLAPFDRFSQPPVAPDHFSNVEFQIAAEIHKA
jgi:hypothetical protein